MNEELLKSYWSQVNDIEQLNCKLNNCQSIIVLCAERTLGEESGALWAAADMLTEIETKLDESVYELLNIYRKTKPVKSRVK